MSDVEEEKSNSIKLKEYLVKQMWKDIILVILMVGFTLKFVGFRAVIPTGSMLPTLQIGKSYLVSIVSTHFRENKGLKHGDIAVFTHELEFGNDDLVVKRVIGLPGDTIYMQSGFVYRNGERVIENYVKNKDLSVDLEEFIVPPDEIFLLGDNRQNSHDGRYWKDKTVHFDEVVGEMIVFSSE